MASQKVFETVYRSRQSFLHHMAYMRMAKVLLTQQVLERAGISLERKSVLDYGFGAGTFFRYCPVDTRLFGVEIDPVNVADVGRMLSKRGHKNVRLECIDINEWERHPMLQSKYDVILCSHVLEHLSEPAIFMQKISCCLEEKGAFVGLVPINELRKNPHHAQIVSRQEIMNWHEDAGLKLRCYMESDPWLYWVQPMFTYDTGPAYKLMHALAQLVSFGLGVPATFLRYRAWEAVSRGFACLTRSKTTQAAFVCGKS